MNVSLSLNKNNYYCLRFRVHQRLIPFFKKPLIRKSLYTKNKRQAQLRANQIYTSYLQILNTLSIISTEQTNELTNRFVKEELNQNIGDSFVLNSTKYRVVSTTTLQSAYDKFCIWYKQQNIGDKQYSLTTNKLINLIFPYLGVNSNVEDITLETVEEFREFLYTMPNINKKAYKHLSFKQITELSNIPSEDLIGLSTQIKYLKILKQFFSYMLKANLITYNPCVLLNMPNNTISNREPFDANDISKLFNIFERLDDRKYIYYILAYTGMRPSEFWKCKISISDTNILYFDLSDKSLGLKTQSSHRKIPLHHKLVEMNISEKLSSLQYCFTQAGLSKYFNKTIKPSVTDDQNKIMYSFRHTVATELKRAEVHMDKVSELLGHSYTNSTMTKEVYAHGYTLEQLQETINNIPY
ncbi:tyrosine-type recombinase/integrase [Sulfurimonas sp. SAG-AH-194-I05]|nr:tyrosine-type recombinase/integrase [Sulfurimonas sp. SAG-AH-194-I05]MDF1875932.1 tyrosine-type recombinase/integrase [Sulfurimonas sp. SAG-AH-194-I05]